MAKWKRSNSNSDDSPFPPLEGRFLRCWTSEYLVKLLSKSAWVMAGRAERLGYVQGAVLPEQSAGLVTWAVGVGVDRAYSIRPEHVAKLLATQTGGNHMPNWAYCNLDVYGPIEEIIMYKNLIAIKDQTASGEEFDSYDLSLAHPMPAILQGTRSPVVDSPEIPQRYYEWLADGTWTQEQFDQWKNDHEGNYYRAELAFKECGYRDWYSWCNDNWGAKWPPSDVIAEEVDLMGGHWQLHFNSPWSPPTGLIRETARRFPRLAFILSFREESKAYTGAIGYRFVDDDVEEIESWYNFDDDTLPESIGMRRDEAQEKLTKALEGDEEFDEYDLYDELDDIDMELALYAVEEVEEAMDVSSLTK